MNKDITEEKFRIWLSDKGSDYCEKYHIVSNVIAFLYDQSEFGFKSKPGDFTDKDLMIIVEKLAPVKWDLYKPKQ